MNYVNVGMKVFHKTDRTPATVIAADEWKVTIELEKELGGKRQLILPLTHFGEWLFFDIADFDRAIEELAYDTRYAACCNEKIVKVLGRHTSAETLIEYLQNEFQFEGFHHYTDFQNFIKIMREGILHSRATLLSQSFFDSGAQNIIENTDRDIKKFVRFFYKGRTPTLYHNEGIKPGNVVPHMPIPVLLIFGEDIAKHAGVEYLAGSGSRKERNETTDSAEAKIKFDWQLIFSRGPYVVDQYDPKSIERKKLVTNKRNAEFLYPQKISTEYLKKIIFRTPADLKHAKEVLGEDVRFCLDEQRSHFNYHEAKESINFLEDYVIERSGDILSCKFVFFLPFPSSFSHRVDLIYKDNKNQTIDLTKPNEQIKRQPENEEGKNNILCFRITPERIDEIDCIEYSINKFTSAIWRNTDA